ncbi:MAG TPA: HU family DNA-binding protein [Pyrinomonadaceae bacterium]
MTQSEVINYVAERTSLNRAQAKQFFEDLASLAVSEVTSGGEFVLPGFGKLVRAERKAREGRNPATGETIQIPAKTTLKFRVSKAAKTAALGGDPFTLPEADADTAADELGGDPVVLPD